MIRQRSKVKIEIQNIEDDIRKTKNDIWMYQQRIERTPKREEELIALNRDYNNIQESYSSLLNRKLEAEIAVNMERKQKGEQFRVIDSAKLPMRPAEPDLRRILVITVLLGLLLGGGVDPEILCVCTAVPSVPVSVIVI